MKITVEIPPKLSSEIFLGIPPGIFKVLPSRILPRSPSEIFYSLQDLHGNIFGILFFVRVVQVQEFLQKFRLIFFPEAPPGIPLCVYSLIPSGYPPRMPPAIYYRIEFNWESFSNFFPRKINRNYFQLFFL